MPALIDSSEPRPRVPRLWFLLMGFAAVVLFSIVGGGLAPTTTGVVDVLSGLFLIGLMIALSAQTVITVRRYRAEQQQVETAGELVQLRRWPEAAATLEGYLSRPARTRQLRAQALIYLASVLSRYHRFDDAASVYDHLLEHEPIDAGTAHGLRLGRAMAILREDHLFDANQAISELRRSTPREADSAGLALIEIYRDVKTGHPAEAIELFERKRESLRDQLGHRVADAYALVARAYDLLNRPADAQAAYEKATLLSPPAELSRRYPEVQKLDGCYAPAVAPPEAA